MSDLKVTLIALLAAPAVLLGAPSLALNPDPVVLTSGRVVLVDLLLFNPDGIGIAGAACRLVASEPGLVVADPMPTPIEPIPLPLDPPGAPIGIGEPLTTLPMYTDGLLAKLRITLPEGLAEQVRSGRKTVDISFVGQTSFVDLDFNEHVAVGGDGTRIIPEPATALLLAVVALLSGRRRV